MTKPGPKHEAPAGETTCVVLSCCIFLGAMFMLAMVDPRGDGDPWGIYEVAGMVIIVVLWCVFGLMRLLDAARRDRG